MFFILKCLVSGGQAGRNPFSPVKDLPILGFFGAVAAAPLTQGFSVVKQLHGLKSS